MLYWVWWVGWWVLSFSLLVGFKRVVVLVFRLGDCFVPGCWVGDLSMEVEVVKGVSSRCVDVVCDVVGGAEELPVGGERFVFCF